MSGDMREDIEKAFQVHETPEPAGDTPDEVKTEPSPSVPAEGAVPEAGVKKEVVKDPSSGKFVSGKPASPSTKSDTSTAPGAAAPTQTSALKAPVSWKPEERELWGKMDPAQQAAVIRREREIDEGLRTSAEARRFHQEFSNVVQPYMGFIAAEGGTPLSAFQSLMQSGAILRVGSPQQKAALIVDAITRYGVDIPMLDSLLSGKVQGQQAAPQNDPNLRYIEQQLAPLRQFMNDMNMAKTQGEQMINQSTNQTIEQFAQDPANEFFEDVKADMADLLEMAANRNQVLSLQDAYKKAILLHPQVSQVVAQRNVNDKAAQLSAAAQKATNASASLPSGGQAPSQSDGNPFGMSRRAEIEAAWDRHMSRT
jgi:hypothetical protein